MTAIETQPILCDCGSGLSSGRCCALDPGLPPVEAIGLQPAIEAAELALHVGDREQAEHRIFEVLEAAPLQPAALAVLARIRLARGPLEAAAILLRRLHEQDQGNVWALNELAMLALRRQDAEEAAVHARHAVQVAPDNPQAHQLMGLALSELNRAPIGEHHYRRALDLSGGRHPTILSNLAANLFRQGRMEEARALYAEADAAAPNVRQTLLGWAQMEEADRNLDAAETLIDRVERLAPASAATRLVRASILERRGRFDDALAVLAPADPGSPERRKPSELLLRGRILDRLGRYDEAWAAFEAGKARLQAITGKSYAREQAEAQARDLKAFFERDRLERLPRAGTRQDVAQPVFILGFPRSGTTLMEQTLTASPAIAAGGELGLIHEVAFHLPRLLASRWTYPGVLSELWLADQREGLDVARDYYVRCLRLMGIAAHGARYVTDKTTLNEIHLGLIGLIFPQAPVIHMVRHPLDIMVSMMSYNLDLGHHCGATLEAAARHLVLSADLAVHYRRETDVTCLTVRYEDVVDDQETIMRRVFAFLDVTYDDRLLNFEKNTRYSGTASYAQVSETLYDRSRYRYRHYMRHLEPVLPILEPLIDRLGYTIEA